MAYSRYGRTCEWYIFWEHALADEQREQAGEPKPKSEETLAVWHSAHRTKCPLFTYAEVQAMLASSNFGSIPGFHESDTELIANCLSEFVRDVDAERGAA